MAYAKKLTKQELIDDGITEITEDGRVFKYGEEITLYRNKGGYFYFNIYLRDPETKAVLKRPITRQFKGCKKPTESYVFKTRSITLQRAIWAWFKEEVPSGYVVDHVNNRHINREDYRLENLQLLTPKANVNKDKTTWHTSEILCKLNKPRSFFEEKLSKYTFLYEKAKAEGNATEAHKLRSNISHTRARLRFWDSHKEEAELILAEKEAEANRKQIKKETIKLRAELKAKAREAKEAGDRKEWHRLLRLANEIQGGKN